MFEELVTGFVDEGYGRVALEISCASYLFGEIVAGVEEFEEAAYGVEVFVYEVDSSLLRPLSAIVQFHFQKLRAGYVGNIQKPHH